MDPRQDCEVTPDNYSMGRMIDRGLAYTDLERMVRDGSWQPEPDGTDSVTYKRWTIRIKSGGCVLHVLTVYQKR